jgi:hypothetical protein
MAGHLLARTGGHAKAAAEKLASGTRQAGFGVGALIGLSCRFDQEM